MSDKPRIRVVYLGTCTLDDKKPGEVWAPEALAAEAKTTDQLRATGSPFSKRRQSYTVGAVYEATADLGENGRLTSLTRDHSYRAMLDTEAVSALVLREKGLAASEQRKKAEAKARRDGGPSLDSLLDQVARIVARTPFQQQDAVVRGFTSEVQRRALELWRKGR